MVKFGEKIVIIKNVDICVFLFKIWSLVRITLSNYWECIFGRKMILFVTK